MIALLTLTIGLFSDRVASRAIDYLWPDADLPELEYATIVTVKPDGYIYSVIFCGKNKSGRSFSHSYTSDKTPIR